MLLFDLETDPLRRAHAGTGKGREKVPRKALPAILIAALLLTALFGACAARPVSPTADPTTDPSAAPTDSPAPASPGAPRPLHVDGTALRDDAGNTVRLTGMSSHGLLWYPEYANSSALRTLKSCGANVFRVAVYADDSGGGCVQRPEDSLKLACLAIENVISEDMYVIVDWHVLSEKNPWNSQWAAVIFFHEISSRYGDCPNVIYEICNEPNGDTTWDDIYSYAESVIPVIRENAPDSVIIVGTPQYSYKTEDVIAKPLPYDNLMYAFHFYSGLHDEHYKDLFDSCEKSGVPVFVSEWGVSENSAGRPAIYQAQQFIQELDRRGISWAAWSLSNKDEIYSAIKPDCTKLGGWTEDDLTEPGRLFFSNFG